MQDQPFPTQNSTLSADALVGRLVETYALPGPVTCRFFRKGICDTYAVKTAEGDYFLKIYMHGRRTELDVTEEVRLLNHLSGHGVSVARPTAQRDGLYVSGLRAAEGRRYAVLFEAAKGVGEDDQTERIQAFGEMVARFHQCSDMMQGPYRRKHLDMKHLVDDNLAVIAPFMGHRPVDFKLIESVGDQCRNRVLDLLSSSKPEYGICHGDLHGGDVLYGDDNRPVLFDFDSSGCGWRALDIGVFLATSAWMDTSREAEDRRQGRLETFLRGYLRCRGLRENELSAIQVAPPIHHIFLMGHVLRYTAVYEGEHWADDDFIDWHMDWFRYWAGKRG